MVFSFAILHFVFHPFSVGMLFIGECQIIIFINQRFAIQIHHPDTKKNLLPLFWPEKHWPLAACTWTNSELPSVGDVQK